MCANSTHPGSVYVSTNMRDFLGVLICAWHKRYGKYIPRRMQCPLRCAKMLVHPELAAAWILRFGDEIPNYTEVGAFRREFQRLLKMV
jgi:hypothetical protein